MMMWLTLWPSAQQTRSCCCLPVMTPPLKCGARHAWCVSPRPPDTHHGLANCFPPCSATEDLIWMANPDLDPGGCIETLQKDTPWAERHLHMGVYENNKGTCISLVALLQDVPWPTNHSKMKSDLCIKKQKKMGFLDHYICERSVLMCKKTHKTDINRICDFKGQRIKNFKR